MKKKEQEKAEESVKKPKKETRKGKKIALISRSAKKEKTEKEIALPKTDPYDVIRFVLMTEKSVRQIETQNKLTFIVDREAEKKDIKAAAFAAFNAPVSGVRTMIDQAGRKKAFIKFKEPGQAGEIAIRLGII